MLLNRHHPESTILTDPTSTSTFLMLSDKINNASEIGDIPQHIKKI